MPEFKNTFTRGKMNIDLDERLIPNGQYRSALNVQVSTSESSEVGTLQNVLGNTEINSTTNDPQFVGGGWECVGSIADEKNDTLYSFLAHSSGISAIIEYTKDDDINPVLIDRTGDELNFELGEMITGINIIDGILLWTDGNTEPRKINIERCKAGTSTFQSPTKLIVNGSEVNDKVIKSYWTQDFTNTSGGTTSLFLTTADLGTSSDPKVRIGDELEEFETDTGGVYSPANRIVTDIDYTTGEVTINTSIYNGSGTAVIGNYVKFQTFVYVTKDYTTVIKRKPLRPLDVKIYSAGINTIPSDKDPLFEKIFPRFSYRYRYEDGEYSAFAPFTDVVFNSKYSIDEGTGFLYDENTAYDTKEPYNSGMRNMIQSIDLSGFVSPDIPKDVVQVDILYKQENSTTVYVVEVIKSTDEEWSSSGNISGSSYTGKYTVTSENIYAALPESQLLRPWDSVPKTARAQEITGNRLVYGNYKQYYDLGDDSSTGAPISPKLLSDYGLRFNGYKHELHYVFESNLLLNPDFDTDTSDWSLSSGHVHYDNTDGEIDFYDTTPGTPATSYQKLNQTRSGFWEGEGTVYKISFEVKNWVTGNIDGRITNGTYNVDFASGYPGGDFATFSVDLVNDPNPNRIHEVIVTMGSHTNNSAANSFNGRFYIESSNSNNFEGSIDNVSVQKQVQDVLTKTFKDGGFPSVKSQRNYQLGVVYGDKYGRETPVFTSSESSVVIPWEDSSSTTPITNNDYPLASFPLQLKASISSEHPDWADYYKLFVKETSGEYYNLVMDAMYNPTKSDLQTEEHIWLSFASSERNKISKDDYIILKKRFTEDPALHSQVTEENKFRVLDVQNEPPEAIKFKYIKLGEIINDSTQYTTAATTGVIDAYGDLNANIFTSTDNRPIITQNNPEPREIHINRTKWINREGQHLTKTAGDPWEPHDDLYFSFTKSIPGGNDNQNSQKYKINSLNIQNPNYVLRLEKRITDEDSALAEVDTPLPTGFATGDLDPNLIARVEKKITKDPESFSGRFFVKIKSSELVKRELENIDNLAINYNYTILAQRNAFYHADNDVSSGYDITSGLTNNSSSGAEDYTNDPDSVHSGGDITNTPAEWQDLVDEMDVGEGNRWFIDKMHMVGAQSHASNEAKYAVQPWVGPSVMPPGRLHVGYYPPSNYTTQAIQGASYFSWPTDNTIEPNLPGTNGANFINGLEGIVTTNSTHVNQNPHGIRQWYDLSWSSGSQSGGVINNTYGTQTGKIYMHISFLAPGDDLHDGTLHCTNAELLNSNLISGGWDSSSQIYNNLQAIHGGGVFTWYESGNNPYNFKSILETGPNNTPGTSTWNSGTPGYDPGSNGDLLTKHDTQWDLVDPQDIAFANNLQAGNKFRFTNDANSTIYTILSSNYLNPLKVYNHTSWRTIYKTDGSSGSTATGDSVEEAVIKWAKSTDGTNYDGANGTDADVVALKQKLQDFGSANNRRLVYVVELDNDPSNSSSYNPVSGSTMDSSNFGGIEFVSEDFELNSGEISQKPAIWETEPKESVDLDIYYEASQAYPITLIEENRELFAPIGCRVELSGVPTLATGDPNVIGNPYSVTFPAENYLLSWFGNNTITLSTGVPTDNGSGTNLIYNGVKVKFIRDDGSYTTGQILDGDPATAVMYTVDDRKEFEIEIDNDGELGLSWYNCFSFGNGVESNRIRDDFNGMTLTNGVRANSTLDRPYHEEERKSGLIYSGIYNSKSGVNNLNQFITAEKITKDLNPTYGSIQKLFSRRVSLIAFCEDRVIGITANKNALYNADGNAQLISSNAVLGDANPFVGDFGISKNPESFAKESYRAYFTDKQRGAVLRLSMDGITSISDFGMADWFRDEFRNTDHMNIIGSFDIYKKDYNLTFDRGAKTYGEQGSEGGLSQTVSFSEDVKGWTSFKSFIPESGVSMSGNYYTFYNGRCWKHHDNDTRNSFYGITNLGSSVTLIFNEEPMSIKNFNTLNYDGNAGWQCTSINTDQQSGTVPQFIEKEGKWFNYISGNEEVDTQAFNFQGIGIANGILLDNLVANGTFDTNINGWTNAAPTYTTESYSSGEMQVVASGDDGRMEQEVTGLTIGEEYTFSYEVISGSGNFAHLFPGPFATNIGLSGGPGVYTHAFTATTTVITIRLGVLDGNTVNFDNVSLRLTP